MCPELAVHLVVSGLAALMLLVCWWLATDTGD
jgi:hypothetical protein